MLMAELALEASPLRSPLTLLNKHTSDAKPLMRLSSLTHALY